MPEKYNYLFKAHQQELNSHRGFDIGALNLTMFVTRKIQVPVFIYPYTRLLVEINRSVGNQKLFSEITKNLEDSEKEGIINYYYFPYRMNIQRQIENALSMTAGLNFVWHLSMHTFTPALDGKVRKADIGILYDPASSLERRVATLIKDEIHAHDKRWIVRRNYPYLGKSDGLTTHLRKQFGRDRYCGIELEVNQKYTGDKNSEDWFRLKKTIVESLERVWNRIGQNIEV